MTTIQFKFDGWNEFSVAVQIQRGFGNEETPYVNFPPISFSNPAIFHAPIHPPITPLHNIYSSHDIPILLLQSLSQENSISNGR